jgi:glycosyltransferase involved in cell wall biosynthesis
MDRLIATNATHLLAASSPAASDLFGPRWQHDPRAQVLYCGIDLEPFRRPVDRTFARSEFGFRASDIVFGHVGRFDPQKNHRFLVEIAVEMLKREPNARFLLVGEGPLRSGIEAQFRRAGIHDRAVFTGLRPDVPRLLLGVMDNFLFPSINEGLGLALVEAQAAGLSATISADVPPEADVVPALINRISLHETAATWAESSLRHRNSEAGNALELVENSRFNLIASVKQLCAIYSPTGVVNGE